MQTLFGFVIILISLLTCSVMTGWLAVSLNRKFWPWFFVGYFLPFIGAVIIVCLPVKEIKTKQQSLRSAGNDESFEEESELEEPKRINGSEIHYFPRA